MRGRVPALLATADGEVFRGHSVGVAGVVTGEAVFNTSMTGYQEILTDPSYAGQVVVMTSPHIGNYGVVELLVTTKGTARFLHHHAIEAEAVNKIGEGSRDIGERLENGEVQLVVHTPRGGRARSDGRKIRRSARRHAVPCVTTLQGGLAVARSLRAGPGAINRPRSLQEWHRSR